ncbi:MAG: non-ribosomal peptide synthetase [Acidobacteria bacterium]|nr:non-ribosomal peptide synthetase [Acidobacteriota bacterium]
MRRSPAKTYETLVREAALAARPGSGPAAGAENVAYVMFTSGSTGAPKGIEVTNRNVLRLILATDYFRFGPGETILQIARTGFDPSTLEIWGALLTGGRLAIAPPGPLSASAIAGLIRRFDVTTIVFTAGLFHVVVDEEMDALAGVRQVLVGGDVLSPAHVARLLAAGCPRVVNAYGPTEATTLVCCAVLAEGDTAGARLPIGAPIANSTAYVVGDRGHPAPIGAPGELWLGGDGVARGYAGRPDLTAERFVPDPHGPPGGRLYRTGDGARWLADGRLDFLGRRDGQLKVRGFRVEIGEIESALAALPEIAAAVAVVRRRGGEAEVVAYVVPRRGEDRDAGAVRAQLATRLPRYMIPASVVFLDAFPLNENGKIDRRALPAAPMATPAPATRAMDPIEIAVADLWRMVLGLDRVGPDDDFFEVGGHSLHATRLIAAIRRSFRVDLPMAALFEATTIAGLARTLVAHEPRPGHVGKAARALAKLRTMTDGATAAREP